MSESNVTLPEGELDNIYDGLATLVVNQFNRARAHRNQAKVMGKSVELWFSLLYQAYHKIHEKEELDARPGMSSYFGLCQIKSNMTASYLRSKFVGNGDKVPFNIEPTPIVELSKRLSDRAFEIVRLNLAMKLQESGIPQEAIIQNGFVNPKVAAYVTKIAKESKELQRQEEMKLAVAATEKMKKKITDQLVEASYSKAMTDLLYDLSLYPYAVIAYDNEIIENTKWSGNKYVKERIAKPSFRRVNPQNIYFAPDATSAQDGEFIIEVMQRSRDEMLEFVGNKEFGYIDDAILDVVDNCVGNWAGLVDEAGDSIEFEDGLFTVIKCQTLVSGMELREYGCKVKESDMTKYFVADIEVIDRRVIRCQIVNHPLGERTYFSANYKRIAGNPYGVSVGMMVYDRQLVVNRIQYAMLANSEYSSGPSWEVNANAFDHLGDVSFRPYSKFYSSPKDHSTVPVRMHQVQPTFLMQFNLLQNQIRLADDECGLPAFLNGDTGLRGAGRTLGGLALINDNAVLGLENCASNIDEFIIRPLISLLYSRNMMGQDDEIKADAKIQATGLLGLKAEVDKAKALAGVVPQLGALREQGVVPDELYSGAVRDYLDSMGLPVDNYMPNAAAQFELNTAVTDRGVLDGRSLRQMNK